MSGPAKGRERHLLNCNFRPGLAFDPRCPACRTQWQAKSERAGYVSSEREDIHALATILARPAVWDMLLPDECERARRIFALRRLWK